MTTSSPVTETTEAWFSIDAVDVVSRLDSDTDDGLSTEEARRRLEIHGPNEVASEPPPTPWDIAKNQLSNPMNIMLLVVSVLSFVIGQIPTGAVVLALVAFNVIMGTNQERKAMASVDALADLQVPVARVRRDGQVAEIDATGLVPGDILLLEAGDVVPADARIVTSATLEVQEASLTGESAPVPKNAGTLPAGETALGDRTDMVFQNTDVTRGSATVIVVATGASTQMGHIADMVSATKRTRSPLQRELDGLTRLFGFLAWGAVAIIIAVGWSRDQDRDTLILLGISTAISAIPTGLPTFVQLMLSSGSQRLAEHKAVVKSLTDVETLGGTTAINSDKTGTLTMNAMTATTMLAGGQWFTIEGGGYAKTGAIRGVAGAPTPDFSRLALGLALCSDATVADDESIIGDPTEAALVVLAAKIGVDAEETRRAMPRLAQVPFDSEYKFMATIHDVPGWTSGELATYPGVMVVKGAPDVVIDRAASARWNGEPTAIDTVRDDLLAANRELSEKGLRVLAFAAKGLTAEEFAAAKADPMAAVAGIEVIALVGIIDPLRAEAKDAVRVAMHAGVDVRMITGDHTITARAIADELGLGPGVISGTDLQALSDEQVLERLDELHVFGRVAPEDKVRLTRLLQESDNVVAMTGDAVNDAAALKQADIGVAMGSGSEVTKQAGRLVLTDDNFATLIRAVELGRDIYRRISSYVKLQITVLSSVLQLMLLATILNINEGVALFPMMLLFAKFFVIATVVVGFVTDVPDPSVMERPPRSPGSRIASGSQGVRWAIGGLLIAAPALLVLQYGPDEPSTTVASTSMTMAFAIVALAGVNNGLVMRREREPAWAAPVFPYLGWIMAGWAFTWAAVELGMLQRLLSTVSLTGGQWVAVLALSLVSPAFMAIDKAIQLRRAKAMGA